MTIMGTRVMRAEDHRLLTVGGTYVADLRLPELDSWSYQKFTKRAIDWAIVGVAVQGGSVALVNMAPAPIRASAVEQALAAGSSVRDAAVLAADGARAPADLGASTAFREHLARVLVARGLAEARSRE